MHYSAQQLFHVPVSNTDRSQALVQMKQETRRVFQYSSYKLLYCLSGLTQYAPSFFFPTSDNPKVGVCCAIAPIPDVNNSKYFGPYPVECIYGLAGQQMKNLGKYRNSKLNKTLKHMSLIG